MTDDLYESIVDGLRRHGWTKEDAMEEADKRMSKMNQDYCKVCGGFIHPGQSFRADEYSIWHADCAGTE